MSLPQPQSLFEFPGLSRAAAALAVRFGHVPAGVG